MQLTGCMYNFLLGYNQYAVKAFEINALDYIVKPISKTLETGHRETD